MEFSAALFGLFVSSATAISLAVGTFLAIRKYRKERIAERVETVRDTVQQILGEMTPKLDRAVSELTVNGGNSTRDKVEELSREMKGVKKDLHQLCRSVDQLNTHSEYWIEESKTLAEKQARLAERVAVVEVMYVPADKKGSRRWQF